VPTASKPSAPRAPSFPRRDADGRIPSLPDMLAGVAFNIIVGVILVVVIDGAITLIGRGSFGSFSGWIAGVLAVWMFVEDFRAWKAVPARFLVALFGVIMAVVLGAGINVGIDALPRVFSGAISVAIASVCYAVIWFFGIRFFADRAGER
jgi:hypothetical protein